ncbi:MAG: hypothetical protein J1E06_11285 [Acutalibacter sp.]|nr:hypothetical protein [Acutalibacter sp.]
MNFIIEQAELALFAATTEMVETINSTQYAEANYCQNCRDSCDSWCTQMCFSAPTKNPPTHP